MGHSPYSSISAFAGNPLFISLERLVDHGWLHQDRLTSKAEPVAVDYDLVHAYKEPLLVEAAQKFLASAQDNHRHRFDRFSADNAWVLDDFTLFDALRHRHHK